MSAAFKALPRGNEVSAGTQSSIRLRSVPSPQVEVELGYERQIAFAPGPRTISPQWPRERDVCLLACSPARYLSPGPRPNRKMEGILESRGLERQLPSRLEYGELP